MSLSLKMMGNLQFYKNGIDVHQQKLGNLINLTIEDVMMDQTHFEWA